MKAARIYNLITVALACGLAGCGHSGEISFWSVVKIAGIAIACVLLAVAVITLLIEGSKPPEDD